MRITFVAGLALPCQVRGLSFVGTNRAFIVASWVSLTLQLKLKKKINPKVCASSRGNCEVTSTHPVYTSYFLLCFTSLPFRLISPPSFLPSVHAAMFQTVDYFLSLCACARGAGS